MAGFLSDSMKSICNQIISDSAATWEYDVFFYKNQETLIISTDETQFNYAYSNSQSAITKEYTPVTGSFPCRVLFIHPYRTRDKEIDDSVKENVPETLCRLKVRPDCYQFISGIYSASINGQLCNLDFLSPRPHSMFQLDNGDPQFYDILCNIIK